MLLWKEDDYQIENILVFENNNCDITRVISEIFLFAGCSLKIKHLGC